MSWRREHLRLRHAVPANVRPALTPVREDAPLAKEINVVHVFNFSGRVTAAFAAEATACYDSIKSVLELHINLSVLLLAKNPSKMYWIKLQHKVT